jgi:short subunit dehydrogenase-like uncharacterized protein
MLMIYGATGYTGTLIAKEAKKQNIPIVLAGRSREKLELLGKELGVEVRAFGLESVSENLQGIKVLLNTAGPFSKTSKALVEACLQQGVHYLDIAGEVPEFETIANYSESAKQANIMLMPGVGFGVVPTDALALYLKERLSDAVKLELAYETVGDVSQGTLSTVFGNIHTSGVVRRNGKLETARPAEQKRSINFGEGPKVAVSNPWRADLFTAYYSTGIPSIETFSVFPGPVQWMMQSQRSLGGVWGSKGFQGFLNSIFKRLPAGPSEAELQKGKTHVWGEVKNAKGQSVRATLHGSEAYVFTARSSVLIAKKVLSGQVKPGFQTPASVYGSNIVMEITGVTREENV